MKPEKLTVMNNIKISFNDKIEGTYIVDVEINNQLFYVSCQSAMTHNYKESDELSCSNDSGCDIYDSGLNKYLESIGIEDGSDKYNEIVAAIEECAEAHQPENSVLRIIKEKELDDSFRREKGLFGAFGPTNVHHEKYINKDREIIVTSEDSSEPRAENQLLGYKTFSDQEDYESWMDEIYANDHYADCSVSYRAWQDICGNEGQEI